MGDKSAFVVCGECGGELCSPDESVGTGVPDDPSLPLEGKVSAKLTDEVFEICLQRKSIIKSKSFSPRLKSWNCLWQLLCVCPKEAKCPNENGVPDKPACWGE